MNRLITVVVLTVLLLTLLTSLVRVVLGPTRADRLLSLQVMSTAGTAMLLLMAYYGQQPALIDAALIIALLAAVINAALVQLLRAPRYD